MRTILFPLALICIAAIAGARPEPNEPSPLEPADEETSSPIAPREVEPDPWLGEEEPLLSGPRLVEEPEGHTLVRFEFRGNLRRLDRTPEEAALDALNLEQADRDPAEQVVSNRRGAVDRLVQANVELIRTIQLARAAKPELESSAAELIDRIATMGGPKRMRDEIAERLPDFDRREFQRMIDEYWRALVLDELQQAQTRNEKLSLSQARLRVTLGVAANELRRAFERRYQPRDTVMDSLLEELSLDAPQQDKVAEPIRALAARARPAPSAREAYDLTIKVLPYLDAEQQRVWTVVLFGFSPREEPVSTPPG